MVKPKLPLEIVWLVSFIWINHFETEYRSRKARSKSTKPKEQTN